jgi:peptide/nickel transport system substrate-binding protein
MTRIAIPVLCAWVACVLVCGSAWGPACASDVRVGVTALPSAPGNLFAARVANDIQSVLFDGLTRFDRNGNLAPALAASWKNESPTTWRFVVRRDVVFSNGEPFTAAAAAATLTWLQSDSGRLTPVGSTLPSMTAEAEDDHVLIVHTDKPDPLLPRRLAQVMIAAPQAWADMGPEAYARTPATTGPFKVSGWGGPDKLILVANTESWRAPKADRLVLTVIPDHAARVKALAKGQIDIASYLGVEDMDAIENANMLTAVTPAMAVLAIAFRQEASVETPLRDLRVRQALNYAVDKNALNQAVLRGLGRPSGQPAARDVGGFDPDVKPYAYDPDKAKALLADAGFADGLTLKFAVAADRYAGDRALYGAVAAALAKVGVTAEIVPADDDAWTKGVDSGEWDDGVVGFSLPFDGAPTNDINPALETYSCLKLVPFVCDRDVTARISAAQSAMGAAKRANMLGDLARTFHDQTPALYLTEAFDVFGVSRKVEGFAVANRIPIYENIAPSH